MQGTIVSNASRVIIIRAGTKTTKNLPVPHSVRLVHQFLQKADFSLDGISGSRTRLIDMTGDDWVSWSYAWSSSKAEDVVDGSGGSWFCAGGQTRGAANGEGPEFGCLQRSNG